MASELLVTRKMALAIARGRFTFDDALGHLAVSPDMLNRRINMTGARKQAKRERANGAHASTSTSASSAER